MNKKTKVICTMGPASDDKDVLKQMMKNGMNIARFNFSHGTHEEHLIRVNRIKELRNELGYNIGILQDTKGPEIRLGIFKDGKVELKDGNKFTLTTKDIEGTVDICSITYKGLINDAAPGTIILINDGLVELEVEKITETDIICNIIHGGVVSNRKAINVPSIKLNMPFLSDIDKKDLEFGATVQYDYVALSFVRSAADVKEAREYMDKFNYHPFIISKIENQEGIDNLEEIIDESDGIMIARGDMGVEIRLEKVPEVQQQMINSCLRKGKVVIVATNMLESMCENPRPTRAEVNDVANAVYQGASCTMLSGESAAGKFPVNAVETMSKINAEAENYASIQTNNIYFRNQLIFNNNNNLSYLIANSAVQLADNINAAAIVCLSLTGTTIKNVASLRPKTQIIGCTPTEKAYRTCSILYNTTGLLTKVTYDDNELIKDIIENCLKNKLINKGDTIIFVAGLPLGKSGSTNMIKVVIA